MKIRCKMITSLSTVILIFVVVIGINVKNSRDLQVLDKTSTISYALSNAFLSMYNSCLIFRVEQNSIENHLKDFNKSKSEFVAILEEFNNAKGKDMLDPKFQERWSNINKLWEHTEGRLNSITDALAVMDGHEISALFRTRSFSEIISDTSLFSRSDKYRLDYTKIRSIGSALDAIGSTADVFNKALISTRDALDHVVVSKSKINTLFTYISTAIATLLALLFSFIFSGNISRKIGQIKTILHQISSKNLAVNIDINSNDEFNELGDYVKEVIRSLHRFIQSAEDSVFKVIESKNVITDGTNESAGSLNNINSRIAEITSRFSVLDQNIEKSSQDITSMDSEIVSIVNNISDQSNAVSNSSSAIEEMTASVNQIAILTSKKQDSTNDLLRVVASGGVTVENTLDNIQQVNNELDRVKDLVDVIKNVADQTNILSMNAAIESAHAGDAGKGFSVVADEIRSLAEYTSNNVQDINAAINSISERIESSLKASEESSIVFEKINRDVHDFSLAMSEIASSIEELAAGGAEVLNSTNRVSSLNSDVYDGAGRIKEQSAMIDDLMHSIQNISRDVNDNIKGISKGTNSVLQSFTGINDISSESGEQISELARHMREYTLNDQYTE